MVSASRRPSTNKHVLVRNRSFTRALGSVGSSLAIEVEPEKQVSFFLSPSQNCHVDMVSIDRQRIHCYQHARDGFAKF